MKQHRKRKVKVFDVVNIIFFLLVCLTILIPFLHLLSISLSPAEVATKGGLHLWPEKPTIDNYKQVVKSSFIWSGYKMTILRTVIGTVAQLLFTALGAYALSKPFFPHRRFWTIFIVFTMFFSGGMIPDYLLIKKLHLFNTLTVMILPGLVSAYNLVLMRNFFSSLPPELEESCMVDGAGRLTIFVKIVLPCSLPILATIGLWLAVAHWNAWFDVLLYVRDTHMYVLQIVLRRIILEGTQQMMSTTPSALAEAVTQASSEGLKAAATFVATLPIVCVYPFIQKYFVKGIMIGSLKG